MLTSDRARVQSPRLIATTFAPSPARSALPSQRPTITDEAEILTVIAKRPPAPVGFDVNVRQPPPKSDRIAPCTRAPAVAGWIRPHRVTRVARAIRVALGVMVSVEAEPRS